MKGERESWLVNSIWYSINKLDETNEEVTLVISLQRSGPTNYDRRGIPTIE